ncbi:uncharacterized protein LOC128990532 [Macrosteles quadrilineatus]|uniref:uncharacterized protein LOC128990532 n=1 Tax=Macrosteles quadrilineatus TaxID=74068 RepID=UPI0023E21F55|nr:uncharacterized protein LOC128990532 [Macrosteles quadrilineatus]
MEHLCRLCGSEEGIKVDIFEHGSDRAKKINNVLPVTVLEHDSFPKQICHHCSYKVEQFYEFYINSSKTQEMLRNKVPWLKGKKVTRKPVMVPPMVTVPNHLVNVVAPQADKTIQLNGEGDEDYAIVIDDSPNDDSTNGAGSENTGDEESNKTLNKRKRTKSKSLWETKKRKKRSRKPCRIAEVFSTNEEAYQNLNNENDPLHQSLVESMKNKSLNNIVENSSCTVNSPKSDRSVEKGILTDDNTDNTDNIALPKYILTTKLPRVGNIYTCERCGTTFLNPQAVTKHRCGNQSQSPVREERPIETSPQHHLEDLERNTVTFYYCNECNDVFTRQSQLISHKKKHNIQTESSSDDSFKPFNRRKKHHKKMRHKRRLLDSNHHKNNTYEKTESDCINLDAVQSNITRHSLLSSDSE